MMPSNARLLTCPACGGKKKILSLASGNTFDGEVWSDLKKIYPMLPEPSFVQKCPECGNYYLLSRQKTVEYDKEFSFFNVNEEKIILLFWMRVLGFFLTEGKWLGQFVLKIDSSSKDFLRFQ